MEAANIEDEGSSLVLQHHVSNKAKVPRLHKHAELSQAAKLDITATAGRSTLQQFKLITIFYQRKTDFPLHSWLQQPPEEQDPVLPCRASHTRPRLPQSPGSKALGTQNSPASRWTNWLDTYQQMSTVFCQYYPLFTQKPSLFIASQLRPGLKMPVARKQLSKES